jgi:hypothetical protein
MAAILAVSMAVVISLVDAADSPIQPRQQYQHQHLPTSPHILSPHPPPTPTPPPIPPRWGTPVHLPLLEAGAEAVGHLAAIGSFGGDARAATVNTSSGSLSLVGGPTPHQLSQCVGLLSRATTTAITAVDVAVTGVDALMVAAADGSILLVVQHNHSTLPTPTGNNCQLYLSPPLLHVPTAALCRFGVGALALAPDGDTPLRLVVSAEGGRRSAAGKEASGLLQTAWQINIPGAVTRRGWKWQGVATVGMHVATLRVDSTGLHAELLLSLLTPTPTTTTTVHQQSSGTPTPHIITTAAVNVTVGSPCVALLIADMFGDGESSLYLVLQDSSVVVHSLGLDGCAVRCCCMHSAHVSVCVCAPFSLTTMVSRRVLSPCSLLCWLQQPSFHDVAVGCPPP